MDGQFSVVYSWDGCPDSDALYGPMSYEQCREFIRAKWNRYCKGTRGKGELNIRSESTGRLVSYVL